MSDLLSEIDGALWQDKVMGFWSKYKAMIIGGILAIIITTAAISFYKNHKSAQEKKMTGALLSIMIDQDRDTTSLKDALINFADQGQTGNKPNKKDDIYQSMARLNAALIALDNGDTQEAHAQYTTLISQKNNALPEIFVDFAALNLILLEINQPSLGMSEELDAEQMASKWTDHTTRLTELTSSNDNPWRYHAALALAEIKASHQNDIAGAIEILSPAIANIQDIPKSLAQRIQAAHHIYQLNLKNNAAG